MRGIERDKKCLDRVSVADAHLTVRAGPTPLSRHVGAENEVPRMREVRGNERLKNKSDNVTEAFARNSVRGRPTPLSLAAFWPIAVICK